MLSQRRQHRDLRGNSRGFTLVEIMVTVAIVGILLSLGVVSFQQWITSTQVRTAAEGFQNALHLAQSEAVKRNTLVDLTWTAQSPDPTASANGVVASPTGPNWVIQVSTQNPGFTATSANFIQGKAGNEGSRNVVFNATPATYTGTVTFDSWGRMRTPNTGLLVTFQPKSAATPRLQVQVTTGGKIRLCNPLLPVGDPQGCA